MNPFAVLALLAGLSAGASAAMLWLRRRAPEGGYFADSDRASGVLGIIGTSYAVLLAFVIFIAFESYNNARASAVEEANAVREAARTASLMSTADRVRLTGGLICYGRAVVGSEWLSMREGRTSPDADRWLTDIDTSLRKVPLTGVRAPIAYQHFLEQMGERQDGRRGRLAEAQPFVPPVVWAVLMLGGFITICYVGGYADPNERRRIQALMMTGTVTMVASGLMLVWFLDHPYEGQSGSLQPTAMAGTVDSLLALRAAAGAPEVPCGADGAPR